MEGDKFKMAQKFLQRANAIHPEDVTSGKNHDDALAMQDVYYDCYMSSFSKEQLIKRLEEILEGKIEMPEEEVDPELYRTVYVREARKILTSLESGEMK